MLLLENQMFGVAISPYEAMLEMFSKYCSTVSTGYIHDIFRNPNSHFVLYNINGSDIYPLDNYEDNYPCGLIYQLEENADTETLIVYIMLAGTCYRFRKYGYASLLMKEFIEHIKSKYAVKYKNITFVLDALDNVVGFYESLGFKWIIKDIEKYSAIIANKNEANEHIIMEYSVVL